MDREQTTGGDTDVYCVLVANKYGTTGHHVVNNPNLKPHTPCSPVVHELKPHIVQRVWFWCGLCTVSTGKWQIYEFNRISLISDCSSQGIDNKSAMR